jgi:hypothetical protein
MRRLSAVAALVAVLGAVPLFGQMRGGRMGASFGRGFSSHNFGGFSRGFNRGGFVRGGFGRGGFGFNRGGFGHGSRFFVSRGGRFFYGGGPFFIGGSFDWGPDYILTTDIPTRIQPRLWRLLPLTITGMTTTIAATCGGTSMS